MITLIHGEHTEKSRQELLSIIASWKGKEVRRLDGRGLDANGLTQALESTSLFADGYAVVIENLFGKLGRKVKLIESLAAIIRRSGNTIDIVLWEGKEVGKMVVTSLGSGVRVIPFKIPPLIFQFLDGFYPGNGGTLLPLTARVFETDAPELVFSLLTRRIRQLLILSDGGMPEKLAPWQASRLTTQAKHFTLEQLLHMYQTLATIEYSIKSGTSPLPLADHIIHIVSLL